MENINETKTGECLRLLENELKHHPDGIPLYNLVKEINRLFPISQQRAKDLAKLLTNRHKTINGKIYPCQPDYLGGFQNAK